MFSELDVKYKYDGELGAIYTKTNTCFKVWSPKAESVKLKLFKSCTIEFPYKTVDMTMDNYGVWNVKIDNDLDGIYYTYEITHDGETAETIDIYAKSGGVNGERGMVIDLKKTNPEGWESSNTVEMKNQTDAIIYELHVRDFSANIESDFKYKGKFLAFTERGLVDHNGNPIGIEHIKELGVTHVHLLPVFDYQSVDESKKNGDFNWGYDPKNFNFPEGSYSIDPYDGALRIKEFKQLIMTLHNENIGVVMDVVYNHTYDTEDSIFNKTFPNYYYRQINGTFSNGSGCGNDMATERAMMRKFIIDSLCYWAKEYKIDGFRFDLLGLYDIETVNKFCEELKAINPSILLYGEGWTGGYCPLDESLRAVKYNAKKFPDIAIFSDNFRDAIKGNVFDFGNAGFANGGYVSLEDIKKVIVGGVTHSEINNSFGAWTESASQVVNYTEAHDNLTLWDKLFYTSGNRSIDERIAMDNLVSALTFLSFGIPFIQAGQEFLRSKPLGNMNFDANSYNSSDDINSIKWNQKSEYYKTFEYYKGMISIRKKYSCFRISDGKEIQDRVKFINGLPEKMIGISIDDKVIVYFNANNYKVNVNLEGKYNVIADKNKSGTDVLYTVESNVNIDAISAMVLVPNSN